MARLAIKNFLGQFRLHDLEDQNYADQQQKLQGQGFKAKEPAEQGIRENNGGGHHQQGGDEQLLAREAPDQGFPGADHQYDEGRGDHRLLKPAGAELGWVGFQNKQEGAKRQVVETELRSPKVIMNLRMNRMFQRRGRATSSGSTRSVAMVISGRSVSRLVRRICLGNRGRKDRNREAPAMTPSSGPGASP
jgi:hypothetical protein